jgi:excisionase family DNA binding protein
MDHHNIQSALDGANKPRLANELISASQLADILSVSERTLYRLKSIGQLPMPIVLGGSVRWRLTEIREWIAQGCPKPTSHK